MLNNTSKMQQNYFRITRNAVCSKIRDILVFTILIALTACKQSETTEAFVSPSKINVESMLDSIDYQMDITALSVSDLFVLKHAPAARRGFPIEDSYVRHIFETTTWYDSLMWKFDEHWEEVCGNEEMRKDERWHEFYYRMSEEHHLLNYTDEEIAFIKRVKAREAELLKNNFNGSKGMLVNVGNLINPGLLNNFDPALQQQLGHNGFAIVPAQHRQLFHVYEQNDYHEFPAFVTTDLYLQLYHLYFDAMLRDVEQHCFYKLLDQFCTEGIKAIDNREDEQPEDYKYKAWLRTYLTVAQALLNGKEPNADDTAQMEYRQVMKNENSYSRYLGYEDAMFEYSLFRPRGHYTRTDSLQRYFRTMMWLQTVPFQTDRKEDMHKACMLAELVGKNAKLTQLYKQLTEPMDFLMGQPDDVSIMQVWKAYTQYNPRDGEYQSDAFVDKITKKVNEIAEKQTRIRPKFLRTGRNKVRLMPQRYQPDAEVLQEMVDYESDETKRGVPTGLDVFAAMGVNSAERILMEEQNEAKRWDRYKPTMDKMKRRLDSINWNSSVSNVWLKALESLNSKDEKAPYFMQTEQWGKKALNTTLASWAELKHDAILYAKQPMGAECGGGGVPEPIVKGYVEPNTKFWKKAVGLLEQTSNLLDKYGLSTDRTKAITTRIKEMAEFLQRMSDKELAGQLLSNEEYDQLQYIGASFENMSLELIRNQDQNLWEWDDIQGPERKVSLIADVYTANADNNPDKSILYEGVGDADEIYVIVEIQGYLYLMRGGVFSYRELTHPYGEQRMNDEEWQQQLEKSPRLGVPAWMNTIIVPLDEAPVDNDKVFYSSGC